MTRADLLASLKRQPIPFSMDGFACHLRSLTTEDMMAAKEFQKEHGPEKGYQFLFVRSVCDESGTRLLEDSDAAQVAEFPAKVVENVVAKSLTLNHLDTDSGKSSATTPNLSSA